MFCFAIFSYALNKPISCNETSKFPFSIVSWHLKSLHVAQCSSKHLLMFLTLSEIILYSGSRVLSNTRFFDCMKLNEYNSRKLDNIKAELTSQKLWFDLYLFRIILWSQKRSLNCSRSMKGLNTAGNVASQLLLF